MEYPKFIVSNQREEFICIQRVKNPMFFFQGLKKPYNPIIGERFRCYWNHPNTNSRTFYIAEQLSHHPPVTGFYVTNRKDGFNISASILAKSKFYGESLYDDSIHIGKS